jgi:hypothetical protein
MEELGVRRIFLGIALLLPLAAWAGEPAQRVAIIPDQQKGEVRIVIDGQPVMRLTSQSVIVSGDLIYRGVMKDIGNDR